jgi:hypothetical protein
MKTKKPICKTWGDGSYAYYVNGLLHREDGPAIEHPDGTTAWYLKGNCHRIGGPAVEWPNGTKVWWLDDVRYSEEVYWKELFKRGLITEKELFLKLL